MEKKFKNVKVAIKFRDAFFTIFGMFLLLMISCMLSFTFICSNVKEFHDISYQNSVLQMEMRKDLQVVDRMILWSIIKDNQEEKNLFVQQADEFLKQFEANVEKLKETFPDKEHIDELMVEMDKGNEIRKEVISHISANDNESALALFNGEYSEASTSLQNVLVEIGEHLEEDADYQYNLTIIIAVCSFVTMLIIGTICFVFIRKISALLTRLINEPINEIEAAAKEMKAGNLDVKINYESGDELGMLAENFSETCSELHEIVEETDLLLGEMAKGNFNINTTKEEKFVGQFSGIILSMRNLNRQMDETIRQIKAVAEHVAAGSTQLAGSAEELAEGATEQAGAIQEITASIENVASISRDSAKNVQGAYEMVNRTVEDAKKSQTELQELTSAMTRISDTSKEIQNIIGAIEDIAEQTNMLSLNASIEAARAGEAGKGFAVVADQIGKLATDSAQSAANTRELINKALAEIENGNAVTVKTVHALQEILNGMGSFADAAYGASQASESQADMLDQIQKGIEQVSGVVQSNSAQAQETSATSQELSAQSENLLSLVAHFKLRD